MLKNLQSLQSNMQDMQEKLGKISVTGTAGGDMVKITVNGQMMVTEVKIDPIVVDNRDVPMLEDLVRAALSDAISRAKETIQEEFSSLTGGMPMPPGFMGS